MNMLDKFIQRLEKGLIVIAFSVMVVLTFSQVVARFVFNDPISWSEEVSRFLFVWITMLGASHAVAFHKHFAVDFLVSRFSIPVQKKLWYISALCIILLAAIMVGYGAYVTNFVQRQTSPALLISMALPYLCIPVSGLFMIIHVLYACMSGADNVAAAVPAREGGAQ